MVDTVNRVKLNDRKYQNNLKVRYESYNGKLLFPMKDIVPFGMDCKQMYFMSTKFLKDKINGVHVTQFQLAYICNTTHPSHKHLDKLGGEVHCM